MKDLHPKENAVNYNAEGSDRNGEREQQLCNTQHTVEKKQLSIAYGMGSVTICYVIHICLVKVYMYMYKRLSSDMHVNLLKIKCYTYDSHSYSVADTEVMK